MRAFLIFLFCVSIEAFVSQTPVYDDIYIDEEEAKVAYKPTANNFVVIKSKKGTGGLDKVPEVDAILKSVITDIVLVFTETNEAAADKREDNNRERWENLMVTYPQLFQFETTYKNNCQCVMGGNSETLKPSQGFYIYYKAAAQKVPEKKVVEESPKKEEEVVAVVEKKKEEKKVEKPVEKEVEKQKNEKPKKEKPKKEVKIEEEDEPSTAVEGPVETVAVEVKPKKAGYKKPKVSSNKKACRPPCYGYGDEDLNNFFKDQIILSKSQKRSIKGSTSMVKLSLNFDGSLKKVMVNGSNAKFNELVTIALQNMDLWNPAVKAGVTVKSEVRLTLKYDKSSKAIKPFNIMIIPRPTPKCIDCKSDSEIFGD